MQSNLVALLLLATLAAGAHGRLLAQQPESPPPTASAPSSALATTAPPPPPQDPGVCYNDESPQDAVDGVVFMASLSGANNIAPNTTGLAMPLPGPSKGTYELRLDEAGKRASWTLSLCDVPGYVASHLHTGSPKADFAPPLIPLEPYVKPANPGAPPTLLPQLCPPRNVTGCSYAANGSFIAADIIPLPGRDAEAPAITDWASFVAAAKAGKVYINVHSITMPAGLMRGNLEAASNAGSRSASGGGDDSGSSAGGSSAGGNSTDNAGSSADDGDGDNDAAPASTGRRK